MTTESDKVDGGRSERKELVSAIMRRVGSASRYFDLDSIQFESFRSSYSPSGDDKPTEIRIGFPRIDANMQDKELQVKLEFEFAAPSPFNEDEGADESRAVHVFATLVAIYSRKQEDDGLDEIDVDAFAKVNGIYNTWPYLREFVQSSLVRLGLPPYDLPLLTVPTAVMLSGMVHPSVS